MFNSIKLKLVVWYLAVFLIVFAGLEMFLYLKLEYLIVNLADEHLTSELETLGNLMTVEEAHGQLETELAELSTAATGMYAEKLSGHYYQIISDDGTILVRSPSLALGNASLPVVHGTSNADYRTVAGPGGIPVRLVTQAFRFSIGTLTFQAGDSIEETYELLSSFRNIVLVIFPLIFILCGIGVFVITGWALRSLRTFTAKIGQTTEENLNERIMEDGLADELRPLAASFNVMLGRLESSFAKQKQFLSDASHELRTPTSIIKGFCDVTLGRDRSAPDYKETIRKIGETVNRMCDIINRILVISRLDNKAIQFKPVRIDLMDVMRDVVMLIEPAAASKEAAIRLSGTGAAVRGDREGLTEVFTNIVENAIKYNRPRGSVDIRVSEETDGAAVFIEDTGIGIPREEQDKIFDRFYRVDASRGLTVGSGLGLSIVRTIVEAHGGRIEVESEAGKGSIFRVFLPSNPEQKNGWTK
ncbi:MAG: HAMP domain-containing protein [Deltaproteobacteria bacterium]|nr:HAMP domain-containing protein [Deltaproteobacteria bacterium]